MKPQFCVRDLLQQAAQSLRSVNQDRVLLEARILLSHVMNCRSEDLIAHDDQIVPEKQSEEFFDLVKRRLNFEPIAYLVGRKEFYGREFFVDRNVLIPRPETEGLVKHVLDWMTFQNVARPFEIIDLGTGSGCIAVTVDCESRRMNKIFALEKSVGALAVAKKNATHLSSQIQFIQGDLGHGPEKFFSQEQFFDVIVSNPPYIPQKNLNELQPDIRNFEPHQALFAGEDGLDFYRQIFKKWLPRLQRNGLLALECEGPEQISLIIKTFDSSVEFEALSPYLLVRHGR